MGRKSAYAVMALGLVIAAMTAVGMCLPMHSLSIFCLFKRLVRFRIGALWVLVDRKDIHLWREELPMNGPPGSIAYARERRWFASEQFYENTDLQELSQRSCSPAVAWLWPNFCEGMQNAFLGGLLLATVCAVNAVLVQGTAAVLVWDYVHRKPRTRVRTTAVWLIAGGLFCTFCMILAYLWVVTMILDSAGSGRLGAFGIPNFVLAATSGMGADWGIFVLLLTCVVQLAQLCICNFIKTGEEDIYEDARHERKAGSYGTMLAQSGLRKQEEGSMAGDFDGMWSGPAPAQGYTPAMGVIGGFQPVQEVAAFGLAGQPHGEPYEMQPQMSPQSQLQMQPQMQVQFATPTSPQTATW